MLVTNTFERRFKRMLPRKIKQCLRDIFASQIFGWCIKKFRIRKNVLGGTFDYSLVSNKEAGRIFWGIWEAAEIRFAKNYANSATIIELGSSVGVTLGVLSSQTMKPTRYVCVEANPRNYEKLRHLTKLLPTRHTYSLYNRAIDYSGEATVSFEILSTAGSRVATVDSRGPVSDVPAITLSSLLEKERIKNYTLITDIEGAEAHIFSKDADALKECRTIIVELENTRSFSKRDQINLLTQVGFNIAESYGDVYVFTK